MQQQGQHRGCSEMSGHERHEVAGVLELPTSKKFPVFHALHAPSQGPGTKGTRLQEF